MKGKGRISVEGEDFGPVEFEIVGKESEFDWRRAEIRIGDHIEVQTQIGFVRGWVSKLSSESMEIREAPPGRDFFPCWHHFFPWWIVTGVKGIPEVTEATE